MSVKARVKPLKAIPVKRTEKRKCIDWALLLVPGTSVSVPQSTEFPNFRTLCSIASKSRRLTCSVQQRGDRWVVTTSAVAV